MSELKPCQCPICGAGLKIHGPEDWKPTFDDPDSGGDPYNAVCDCGFSFSIGTYDYVEFVSALNRRAQPVNEPLTLDELRAMDGEPVYIVGRLYGGWTVPWRNAAKYIARCPDEANISHYPKDYGKTWLAYRRQPERSEQCQISP